ncbi:DUF421 domain-containing protein [Peribacillus huizhouensis]|uniref:Uncharacterized membrane protein YcaP (DUF421 family) n=1 Tax=Peribacillus huizhouensis TaxID=1501239 RepID=A0ABR6CMC6_9BACI|nr:DUF421 domain-containing protein [Peribacillus huizhouensis]MBA9026079.1 uncharacterized membrane protein YcaP (DUF421 family) [Peribacillus huizhouensis]
MSDFMEIIVRTIFAFFLFMVIANFLGKQTLSRMTLHHFTATVTFGSITANLAFNLRNEAWQVATAMITFFCIAFSLSIITLKSRKARKWLSGKPTIIIEDGKILEENLRLLRYTLDTLNHALRQKDVFDIQEVQYAVVEPNGEISLLKYPPYRYVTKEDLNIFIKEGNHFPIELIMEKQILDKNLDNNGLTKDWLLSELTKRGLTVTSVFYAVKGTNGQLYFDVYNDRLTSPIDNETGHR